MDANEHKYFYFVFICVHPLPAIALALAASLCLAGGLDQARRAGWFPLSLVAFGAAGGG
jgi:hypothetical protein